MSINAKTRKELLRVFRDIDIRADKFIKDVTEHSTFKPTCAKGCSHCCNLLPTVTIAETVSILIRIGPNRWAEIEPTVMEHVRILDENPDFIDWFKNARGCVFLVNNECSIYENRPMTCRVHVSGDDPNLCAPTEENMGKTRRILDSQPFEWTTMNAEISSMLMLGLSQPYPVDLPHALYLANFLMLGDERGFRREISLREKTLSKTNMERLAQENCARAERI